MTDEFKNKTAVITGSSHGFGFEMARAFGSSGANIVVNSRSSDSVEAAITMLRKEGIQATGMAGDVSSLADVELLEKHTLDRYGQYDVWINNAGISGPYGPTAHTSIADFEQVIRTNIFGVYYGSTIAMRHFLYRKSGKLINITGRGDRSPQPLQNAYASCKAWTRSFTLALAKEYDDSSIGVYAFNPGMMVTGLTQDLKVIEGYETRLKAFDSILRMWAVSPSTSAQKAVWLASSATDGKTGLMVRQMSFFGMLTGSIRELLRRISRQESPPIEIRIDTVPSAIRQS